MNKFVDFILKNNLTASELARMASVDKSTLSRWLLGETQPSMTSARKIEAATKGKIRVKDVLLLPVYADSVRNALSLPSHTGGNR